MPTLNILMKSSSLYKMPSDLKRLRPTLKSNMNTSETIQKKFCFSVLSNSKTKMQRMEIIKEERSWESITEKWRLNLLLMGWVENAYL